MTYTEHYSNWPKQYYLISIEKNGPEAKCELASLGRLYKPKPGNPDYVDIKHAFQRNQQNAFCNDWLKCAKDTELPNLSSLKIGHRTHHPHENAKEDGWMGEWIEIVFSNKTKLHCDLLHENGRPYGMIKDKKVEFKKYCELRELTIDDLYLFDTC